METLLVNDCAVALVKGIANLLALLIGHVWHLNVNVLIVVGCDNEHVSETVGEKVIHNISLDIVRVPSLSRLSSLVNSGHKLIHVTLRIHLIPKTLTVCWIVATAESLLISIVEEWDASSCERKTGRVLEAGKVALVDAQESSIVVVVHEGAKDVDVSDSRILQVFVLGAQAVHALTTAINITSREEHRVVEKGGQIVLVVANIVCISVEGFAHLENTGGFPVLGPERLGHVRHSVDTDTVKVKS